METSIKTQMEEITFKNKMLEITNNFKSAFKIQADKYIIINPKFIKDTKMFKFVNVPTMYDGFFDVYYKEQRIAIINGLSSALQWTPKKNSNIPNNVIEKLEKMVVRLIKKTNKSKL